MVVEIKYNKLFINNEFVDSVSGKTFPTINPETEQVITQVAEADKADIDKAVKAAREAFEPNSKWRSIDVSARGKLILKLVDLMERDLSYLAKLESLDNGKILNDSVFDINSSLDVLRYYAGLCDKVTGDTIPVDGYYLSMTLKEPVGVCGLIIPWNYPIMMIVWKFGPALAAGCTIVLKPAEQTPLTALYLASLCKEAGFPPGVINVVPGYGPTAGAALAGHNDVDKIAFTGSTEVGRLVMESAARSNLKRVTLELGGKSPLIIFEDVDLDKAVQQAHNAIFANHGQNCCAGSRTFVQSSIYEEFVNKSAELAKKKRIGSPFDSFTEQGPQIDAESRDKILRMIESGRDDGARIVAGGFGVKPGFFVQPTVLADVTDDMDVANEEIFGPVQCILEFDTLEEVITRANDTNYGLAAGVLTNNINTAIAVAKRVRAGTVWINSYDYIAPQTPFGGFKQSGFGRELGKDGIEAYLETKTVTIGTYV